MARDDRLVARSPKERWPTLTFIGEAVVEFDGTPTWDQCWIYVTACGLAPTSPAITSLRCNLRSACRRRVFCRESSWLRRAWLCVGRRHGHSLLAATHGQTRQPATVRVQSCKQRATRSSVVAEGPRDALCQSKSCQLVHKKPAIDEWPSITLKVIAIAVNR